MFQNRNQAKNIIDSSQRRVFSFQSTRFRKVFFEALCDTFCCSFISKYLAISFVKSTFMSLDAAQDSVRSYSTPFFTYGFINNDLKKLFSTINGEKNTGRRSSIQMYFSYGAELFASPLIQRGLNSKICPSSFLPSASREKFQRHYILTNSHNTLSCGEK